MEQRKDRNPGKQEEDREHGRSEHGGPGREQSPMKEEQRKFGEKREPGKFGERRDRPQEPSKRQDRPR
jgi:hypothetical protein